MEFENHNLRENFSDVIQSAMTQSLSEINFDRTDDMNNVDIICQ